MASTIKTDITAWRGATDGQNSAGEGHNGLLSKLQIAGKLYDIKDPAVEKLAEMLDAKFDAIATATTWTPVTKGQDAAKFATEVTQAADGSISVTYGTIRDTALANTAAANKIITSLTQDEDGVVSYSVGDLLAANVGFSGDGYTSTNAQAAVLEAVTKVIGATDDAAGANTIYGAKAYADAAVQTLAGTDWTENAQKVQDIIQELEGVTGNAWSTLVDKLHGMGWGATGDDPGNAAPSVVEYVQHEITKVNQQNAEGIEGLDAVVFGADGKAGATGDAAASAYTGATDTFVAVKVTEDDGKIIQVDVKTNDIASASDLATLDGIAVKSVNGVVGVTGAVTIDGTNINVGGTESHASTKLNAAIEALYTADDTKANKAAITTGYADQWTISYTPGSETLVWTNAGATGQGVDVYVPVSGQSL